MELTAANVHEVVKKCLFKDEELQEPGKPPEGAVITDGITSKFAFHRERLQREEKNITAMLEQLPKQFRVGSGDGWSFLAACMREDATQWGEHRDVESLVVLGRAIGKVQWCTPRELWNAFPGGMPYFVVDLLRELVN